MDDLPIVNLVTEEEAKSTWCPFTRVPADVAINRPLTNYAGERFKHVHCIGPRCMAWRWYGEDAAGEDVGYCGLAGKP